MRYGNRKSYIMDFWNNIISSYRIRYFYVFKKWKCLKKLFKSHDEIELLDVLHSICFQYERIIKDSHDYKSKMKNLLDKSKEIENKITKLFTLYQHKISLDNWY